MKCKFPSNKFNQEINQTGPEHVAGNAKRKNIQHRLLFYQQQLLPNNNNIKADLQPQIPYPHILRPLMQNPQSALTINLSGAPQTSLTTGLSRRDNNGLTLRDPTAHFPVISKSSNLHHSKPFNQYSLSPNLQNLCIY